MKILLTCANSNISKIISKNLKLHYKIIYTDTYVKNDLNIKICQLNDDLHTDKLTIGINSIINIGYICSGLPDNEQLDYCTRRVYNLINSACNNGVIKFINISTLKLYEDFEENLVVDETWETYPSIENKKILSAHLCEKVIKEFARERKIKVTNLRLGWPFLKNINHKKINSAAITWSVIGDSVIQAINLDNNKFWQNFHIQSNFKNQRFITNLAKKYFPNLNFQT